MSETATAAPIESVTSDTDTSTAPATSFAEASKALAGAKTWGEVGLTAPVIEPEGTEPAPESTETAPAAAETADPFAAFSVDAEGRLHRADGSFANAEEITAYNATVPAPESESATPTEDEWVLSVPSRNATEADIEIPFAGLSDEHKEYLTRLKNGYLRGEDARTKIAKADEYLAERRAFETMMETNPESLILEHLPDEKQASLAVALVAKHWDTIAPHLIKFDTDASTRIAEAANAQIRMRDQQRTYENLTAQQKYGVQLESATRALIPEHVDPATAEDFLAVAALDLGNAVRQAGRAIPVEDVPKLLAKRVALYGFDRPAATTEPAPKRPVARPVARSVSATAPTTTPSVTATGRDPAATVRRLVTAQRVAAAVPSAGAGAAPIRAPLAAPNETIEQASARLKKAGRW